MMKIKFIDEAHQNAFNSLISKCNADIYTMPLVYLITLDRVCREHIDEIFDFKTNCLKPECLIKGWITGSANRTLHLAFNLFNGGTLFTDTPENCTVANIFDYSAEYGEYYIQAIKLRYNLHF